MTDLRIRYTKTFIKQALVEALKTKPINKITVKSICDSAEINRSTFYKYYTDVYDLFDKLEAFYLKEFSVILRNAESGNLGDLLTEIAYAFAADGDAIATIFSSSINLSGIKKLNDIGYAYYAKYRFNEELQISRRGSSGCSAACKYSYEFFFSGCYSTLFAWVNDGMGLPVSKVVQIMRSFAVGLK